MKAEEKAKIKAIYEMVNREGLVPVSRMAEELGYESGEIVGYAELLKEKGKIKIRNHYLKEPELESLSFQETRKEMEKMGATEVDTHIPDIPVSRKKPPELQSEKEKNPVELEKYTLSGGNVHLDTTIYDTGDFVPHYLISIPKVDFVTRALLDETKRALIGEIQVQTREVFDVDKFQKLKNRFYQRATDKLKTVLKKSGEDYISVLSQLLVNEMIGIGDVEYLMLDDHIEEVVINSSKDVVWAYHKKHGWLKTNIIIPTEELIRNYSSRVAREVGREITHMNPLLDAHLTTGDRVNATLYPISTDGNTITIRRFSRTPWTATKLMDDDIRTINAEVAAFLWLAIEHEMSVLVAGGTASGKTTMLNAIMPFMPANQRIISMEDTRELNLPEYLQWVPLAVRPAGPEGEGEVSMLTLMQNSLRMRPDRIIVGEVRAKRETEVLFEAMHTGHSVYSTFHAERAQDVVDRITSPPMEIPETVMHSLQLIVVQFRNRRTRQRRTFEIVELTKDENEKTQLNTVFQWDPRVDEIVKRRGGSLRVQSELETFSGLTQKEMDEDLEGKKIVLEWLKSQNVTGVNEVGHIVTNYYLDNEEVLKLARENKDVTLE